MRRDTGAPTEEAGLRTNEEARRIPVWTKPRVVRRSPTARLPVRMQMGRPQARPVRALNPATLSGVHQWDRHPVQNPPYSDTVYDTNNNRFDMRRFREMERVQGRADAVEEWEFFRYAHTWFRIPSTIRTDRTFARDEQDATYVDMMDTFIANMLANPRPVRMRNLPFITAGDALLSRWWNRFHHARTFVVEAVWRFIHGLMVPADAETVDTTTSNIGEYRRIFPVTPEWFVEMFFPVGVPAPTPPSIFYFHREIVRTQDPQLRQIWDEVIELEWAAGFVAAWWHEAARGQRGHVVPMETVEWLRERMENIPVDTDTPFGENGQTTANHVLWAMEIVARTGDNMRNTIYFPGTRLHPTQFVWVNGGTGYVDMFAIPQREFMRARDAQGRLMEINVELDPYGRRPRINHHRPVPERTEERAAQRRRVEGAHEYHYRPVRAPQELDNQGRPYGNARGAPAPTYIDDRRGPSVPPLAQDGRTPRAPFGDVVQHSQPPFRPPNFNAFGGRGNDGRPPPVPQRQGLPPPPMYDGWHGRPPPVPQRQGPPPPPMYDGWHGPPPQQSQGRRAPQPAPHPVQDLTPRQRVFRHTAPTEGGREEVFIEEWRRRYGEPTREDITDARIATPAEDRTIRNGQLARQPGPVDPSLRPRLVLTDNPRARRRPVHGGRIPRVRRRRNQETWTAFEAAQYHRPGHHPDTMSQVSDGEDEDEEGEEEYFDDGRHHNQQGLQRRDDFEDGGGGGGGGGFGAGPPPTAV